MSSSLAHSPADVIAQLLIDWGMGLLPDLTAPQPWSIYVASEPNEPDNCITVYDTLGRDDARLLLTGELQQHRGIQIRIRATDHTVGWVRGNLIRTFLSETVKTNTVHIDSSTYLVWAVTKIGQLLPLGYDNATSKRRLFTLNCTSAIDQQ